MTDAHLKQIIWQIVAAIPRGRLATYGQVAELAGYPRHARYVGTTLRQLPQGTALPWFRVVNARGTLSFPPGSRAYARQKALLESEGIVFRDGSFDLRAHRWNPADGP